MQPLKNFPAFYGTRRYITAFTRALHWSLSWARSIQSIQSQPISLRFILILSTHLRLGLHCGLFPSGFATNILYAFISLIRVTYPAHLTLLDLIILIILGEEYKLRSFTYRNPVIKYYPAKSGWNDNSCVTDIFWIISPFHIRTISFNFYLLLVHLTMPSVAQD
jgi:hypothetical protein